MSMVITEQIVKDVGESWLTLKVDGSKDPTGSENVSIVVHNVDKDLKVRERLLSMQTTDMLVLEQTKFLVSVMTEPVSCQEEREACRSLFKISITEKCLTFIFSTTNCIW